MAAPNENVLVVRRESLRRARQFSRIEFRAAALSRRLLARGNNFFLARATAENDPTHKQIIPYALLACGDRVLHYVRGKKRANNASSRKARSASAAT